MTDTTDSRAEQPVQPRPQSSSTIDRAECLELLTTTTVGRVAFAGRSGTALLPVNFRVLSGDVYVRTSSAGTLSELADHRGEVLFEVDYHSEVARSGWSVVVRGHAYAPVDVAPEVAAGLATLVPWAPDSEDVVLVIRPHAITGRRI